PIPEKVVSNLAIRPVKSTFCCAKRLNEVPQNKKQTHAVCISSLCFSFIQLSNPPLIYKNCSLKQCAHPLARLRLYRLLPQAVPVLAGVASPRIGNRCHGRLRPAGRRHSAASSQSVAAGPAADQGTPTRLPHAVSGPLLP